MSPIPSEPLDSKRNELTTSDGRKVKIKAPSLTPPLKPPSVNSWTSAS